MLVVLSAVQVAAGHPDHSVQNIATVGKAKDIKPHLTRFSRCFSKGLDSGYGIKNRVIHLRKKSCSFKKAVDSEQPNDTIVVREQNSKLYGHLKWLHVLVPARLLRTIDQPFLTQVLNQIVIMGTC